MIVLADWSYLLDLFSLYIYIWLGKEPQIISNNSDIRHRCQRHSGRSHVHRDDTSHLYLPGWISIKPSSMPLCSRRFFLFSPSPPILSVPRWRGQLYFPQVGRSKALSTSQGSSLDRHRTTSNNVIESSRLGPRGETRKRGAEEGQFSRGGNANEKASLRSPLNSWHTHSRSGYTFEREVITYRGRRGEEGGGGRRRGREGAAWHALEKSGLPYTHGGKAKEVATWSKLDAPLFLGRCEPRSHSLDERSTGNRRSLRYQADWLAGWLACEGRSTRSPSIVPREKPTLFTRFPSLRAFFPLSSRPSPRALCPISINIRRVDRMNEPNDVPNIHFDYLLCKVAFCRVSTAEVVWSCMIRLVYGRITREEIVSFRRERVFVRGDEDREGWGCLYKFIGIYNALCAFSRFKSSQWKRSLIGLILLRRGNIVK